MTLRSDYNLLIIKNKTGSVILDAPVEIKGSIIAPSVLYPGSTDCTHHHSLECLLTAQRSLHSSGFTFYHSTIASSNRAYTHTVLRSADRSYSMGTNGWPKSYIRQLLLKGW